MAGARINADLIDEETRWAVEGHFGPFSAASEAAVSKIVLDHRRHGLDEGRRPSAWAPGPGDLTGSARVGDADPKTRCRRRAGL